MSERMVKIRSMVSGTVAVTDQYLNIRRIWNARGMEHRIPFNICEQLLWQNGFRNMLESGTLYIEDMQDKIDLGLEEDGTTTPTRLKVLNDAQMLTLLKVRSYEDFKEEINTLPSEQINTLIRFAVQNELVDAQKTAYIKELTGKDIIKMIARKHDTDEAERTRIEKEERYKKEDGRRQ